MRFYTTKDIALMLHINVITVRRWIEKKQITAYKFDKEYRIKHEDLEIFLANKKIK